MRKLILTTNFALGDIVLMTAVVRDLHRCYPGAFVTDVRTPCGSLWNYNPYLRHLDENDPAVETIQLGLPLIEWSNRVPYHALDGFIDNLNQQLGLHIRCTEFKGDIHLSSGEKRGKSAVERLAGSPVPFWLVFAGGRHEITVKWWDSGRYQAVVDHFRGRIQFVQAGSASDHHPKLEGAIDLRAKTNVRELLQLIYHCQGILCGVTGPMHLAAAVELKPPLAGVRPCVVIAGGRESAHWEAYPGHQFIHTVGALPCCADGGCWKTRTVPLGDGSPKDKPSELCVNVKDGLPFCMRLISPEQVVQRIETYYDGLRVKSYLTRAQATAGQRAVQATAHNAIDASPLTLSTARYAAERFGQNIGECPEHFSGRGIVICAEGLRDLTQSWICIKMLRQLGSALPVELWHSGCPEKVRALQHLLGPLGVRTVERSEIRKSPPFASVFEGQAFAVSRSAFEEVLLLDPATVPAASPDYLFELRGTAKGGAIVWPGAPSRRIDPTAWHLCGLDPSNAAPISTAPMLVNKRKCWKALTLWLWHHEHWRVYYPHTEEGRDTAHLAFCKAGLRYAKGRRGSSRGLCHYDLKGQPVFRIDRAESWNLFFEPRTRRAYPWEADCRKHLDELRRHLEVKSSRGLGNNPNTSQIKGFTGGELIPARSSHKGTGAQDPGSAAFTVVTLHDKKMAGVGRVTAGAWNAYAQRHGYGFVYHDRLLDPNRHPSWNKILAVRDALASQGKGWVMWVDADAMVMNYQLKAERLIPPGRDLVLASDANGLMAGVFMVRCCQWSMKFLDTVFFLGDVRHDPDGYGPKWEQNTMKHILKNFAGFEEHAAMLPPRRLNSDLSTFEPGDFILHLGLMSNGDRERIFKEALSWVVN